MRVTKFTAEGGIIAPFLPPAFFRPRIKVGYGHGTCTERHQHLDEPRAVLVVQHDVETQYLEALRAALLLTSGNVIPKVAAAGQRRGEWPVRVMQLSCVG